MSLQSTVGLARPGTKSLRATVPEGIVAFLTLNEGDQLDWRMEIDEQGERYVVIHKAASLKDQADRIAKRYARTKRR